MGVAQNALLGAGAAVGVAANKLATGMSQISEANDADKNEMMAEKAKLNAYKLKTAKIKARTDRRNARIKDMKSKEQMKDYKETLKKEDKVVRLSPQHGDESLKGPFPGGDK